MKQLPSPEIGSHGPGAIQTLSTVMMNVDSEKQERVLDAFRRWGYLQANLDPLGHFAPSLIPSWIIAGDVADAARRIYSGSIGVEFMHIPDPDRRAVDPGAHGIG